MIGSRGLMGLCLRLGALHAWAVLAAEHEALKIHVREAQRHQHSGDDLPGAMKSSRPFSVMVGIVPEDLLGRFLADPARAARASVSKPMLHCAGSPGALTGVTLVVFRSGSAQSAQCGLVNFIVLDERTNKQLPNRSPTDPFGPRGERGCPA